MNNLFLIILSSFLLAACLGNQAPAPVVHYGKKEGAGSAGVHTVVTGDTLWSVSQRYKIPMQDIVLTNKLSAPFALDNGQRIKLPPPREYKVKVGDTLYSVSRLFGVSSSQVAGQNNLYAPYTLRKGQVLRVSNLAGSAPVSARASASVPAATRSGTSGVVTPASKPSMRKSKITAKTPKRSSSKFLKPVEGQIISSYGPKKNGLHNDGVNIRAPKGSPVRAAENGVVVYAGNELKGSGNLVLVRHEGRWMTAYAHMDKIGIKRGQVIKRGQTLGTVGSTGSVDSPQLHFEVRRGTEAINPARYIEGS